MTERLVAMGEGQCCHCGRAADPVYGPKEPRGFDVYLGKCCGGHRLSLVLARELVGIEDDKMIGGDDEAHHYTVTKKEDQ